MHLTRAGHALAALTLAALTIGLTLTLTARHAAALTLVLVRHAEKGTGDDPPLTPAGEARAARLARLFAENQLAAIYVTDTRRSAATAAPTAKQHAVEPLVRSRKDAAAHVKALAAELRARADADVVLAVEHSDTIPLLLSALGVAKPPVLGDADYGDVFVVTWTATGAGTTGATAAANAPGSGPPPAPALLRLALP